MKISAKNWTHFRASVAFVKRSGVRHIEANLEKFSRKNDVEIVAGIDHRGTSHEGLQSLLQAVEPQGKVLVFHDPSSRTFHPKIFLFRSANAADIVVGSGNLTAGGLYTNYEAGVRLKLDLALPEHGQMLREIQDTMDDWSDLSYGTTLSLDQPLLDRLTALGLVPIEASISAGASQEGTTVNVPPSNLPFTTRQAPGAPNIRVPRVNAQVVPASHPPAQSLGASSCFVMTLQRTDVGVGQTTSGTSRRSPEVFIPLSARNANPDFWGWTHDFVEDPARPGKFDRSGVRMRLGGVYIEVNMMTWPDRHDFRLRSEALRSAGSIGDILRIEKAQPGVSYEYDVEVVSQGTTKYPLLLRLCAQPVRNSQKRFGYY